MKWQFRRARWKEVPRLALVNSLAFTPRSASGLLRWSLAIAMLPSRVFSLTGRQIDGMLYSTGRDEVVVIARGSASMAATVVQYGLVVLAVPLGFVFYGFHLYAWMAFCAALLALLGVLPFAKAVWELRLRTVRFALNEQNNALAHTGASGYSVPGGP